MKYGLIGKNGRMGKEVQSLFSEFNHDLVFSYDLTELNEKEIPDCIIDFSLPEVLEKTIYYAEKYNCPLIIGTTNLSENQLSLLKELSKKIAVVQSNNFSLGIQVLLKITRLANDLLKGYDIEITETHHRFKKDKPSGTAKMIQNIFDKEINVSSMRLGNVFGDHAVNFGNLGETISISHRALSRRAFSEGILISALYVIKNSNPEFLTFTNIIEREMLK
jgi:4-hydroxy-tetrahydrodipicolinate reductase